MEEKRVTHCICQALRDLKVQQDLLINSQSNYFGNLFARLINVDTFPFTLMTCENKLLKLQGKAATELNKMICFTTSFFRIESVNIDTCCAVISLLLPLDIHGTATNSICDVFALKKTSNCVNIDISNMSSVQCFDPFLLKRRIVIEPKW